MRLDVLGSSGSHPGPGSACSGYLVRTASTTLLLDAGNGSTSRLHALVGLDDLDAVLVSHGHADHCADLLGLHYALRMSEHPGAVPLLAPEGVLTTVRALAAKEAPWALGTSFEVREVAAGDAVTIGDVEVTLHHSVHTVPAVTMRLVAGGRTLVYSGDSAGGDDLVDAARGADLLLCEATWQGDEAQYPPGIHMTARGAGRVAADAGVGRLVLTHVQGLLDREVSRREAATTWDGDLDVAIDGASYEV